MSNEEAIMLAYMKKRDAYLHALEAIAAAEMRGLEHLVKLQQNGTDLTIQHAVTALNERLPLFVSAAVEAVKDSIEEDLLCEEHNVRLAALAFGQSAPSAPTIPSRKKG